MITANDARALVNRGLYEEKVKEYEHKIEKEIIHAAKDNHLNVMVTLADDYPLLSKALNEVAQNFTNNGFKVVYACVDYNKYIIGVNW